MSDRRRSHLGLALLISLLVNHGLLWPVVYVLLNQQPALPPPPPVEVELVPSARREEPPPELPPPPPPERRRQRKLAVKRPPPPRPVAKKVEPPRPEPKKQAEKKPEPVKPTPKDLRRKMVEVNNPESDRAPENARFLSDKNRRVEEETRALHTNLQKDHPKPEPSSDPRSAAQKQAGAEKPKIAETREQKARLPREPKRHPLMVMRSPREAQQSREEQKPLAETAPAGQLPAAQQARPAQSAQRAQPLQLDLDYKSQERIDGQEAVKARELARLSPSTSKGGHQQKWERVRSALENFVPEVKPGNQTALGTRADPFALYVARMHRKIHKFWGFGFLVDLDAKPDSNPMNDMSLWTMIEIVVLPGGQVEKATIVRPSGLLTYDVAALDTVFSSAPYETTPRAIRSADGKVYLHWRFHRDQRQCGTFGVDPFILTTPPKGPIDSPATEVTGQNTVGAGRSLRQLHRRPEPEAHHHVPGHQHGEEAAPPQNRGSGGSRSGREAAAGKEAAPQPVRLDPRDRQALALVDRFLGGFRSGSAAAMAAVSALPFHSGGRKVTSDRGQLAGMFADLLSEAGSRQVSGPGRLLSVGQARAHAGGLPAGVAPGDPVLIAPVKLGRIAVVLIVEKTAAGWAISGLNR